MDSIPISYTIAGLNATVSNRLHDTPLLIRDISHPICLPRCDKHMRGPGINMTIKLIVFINLEFGRVFDTAALAVMIAVFPVDSWIDLRKKAAFGRFGEAIC